MTAASIQETLSPDSGITSASDELVEAGWSGGEIASVQSIITGISAPLSTEQIESAYAEWGESLASSVNSIVTKSVKAAEQLKTAIISESHEVYNAKSSITIPDMPPSSQMFTSTTSLDAVNYTINEDYPETFGWIDYVKNWIKINKKKRKAELVMSSGTHIKTDADGNVTIYTKGNLRQIVDGDYLLDVKGNSDLIINGKSYHSVGGQLMEKYGSNHTTKVGGIRKETATIIFHQ